MVWREFVLYQVVTPGEPDGNGRSCLMGTMLDAVLGADMGLCEDVAGGSNVR